MLQELCVKNFAIIDSVVIQFKEKLNILSGETGAGKSVLLKSLGLLMGGKANSSIVRSGADNASIEGLFDISQRKDVQEKLKDLDISCDDLQLIVRRVISAQGKSKIYLNGALSSLSNLQSIVCPLLEVTGHAAPLIEVTGQHESKSLLAKSYHLDILDQYANCFSYRKEFYSSYLRLKKIDQDLESLKQTENMLNQKLDFLYFQKNEIEEFDLQEGEDLDLETKYNYLRNGAKIQNLLALAEDCLYHSDRSCISQLQNLLQQSKQLEKFDVNLSQKMDLIRQATTLLEEGLRDIQDYQQDLNMEPQSLLQVEERISQLRKLQKKYGNSYEDIKDFLVQIKQEISQLENHNHSLEQLELEKQSIIEQMEKLSAKLHKTRVNASGVLQNSVNNELKDLNMKGLKFAVTVQKTQDFKPQGRTDVEFQIAVEKDGDLKPLSKTASGGELSRILLALKRVIGTAEVSRTYLFDEVDTGVSGETAEKVGRKLSEIADMQQVICVTHLPQVACFADTHFFIEKMSRKNRNIMNIRELNEKDRVQEIARLISGEKISKTSLAHAKQLLEQSEL